MNTRDWRRRVLSMTVGGTAVALCALLGTAAVNRRAEADCQCGATHPHRHGWFHRGQRYAVTSGDVCNWDNAGVWYWMRSPEQEQRVIMSLYNRYCIRCHGVDGRGVWDIPDVPDFTDPRWQASRPEPYRARVILEGRGAVMPAFRGTLSLEEAWAMGRYLGTFVPGTELSRPEVNRGGVPAPTAPAPGVAPAATPPPAAQPLPVPNPTAPSPFTGAR